MPEFLTLLPPDLALQKLLGSLPAPSLQGEEVALADALDRVAATQIYAPHALPAFDRSTVDGYAVHAGDTFGASDSLPAYLTLSAEIPMGSAPTFTLGRGQAAPVSTGGMLPPGADAVVMLENAQPARPGDLEILRPAARGENIIAAGEDVQAGEVVIPAGHRLRPEEIGGLAALGILSVSCTRPPRVAILSSGDEVVPVDANPAPGQVRDVNSHALSTLVKARGARPALLGIAPDREEELYSAASRGLAQANMLVITAGSSASARDLTARVVNRLGEPGVIVHGVNVRPGKPTILAVCGGKPVIGLPGNPVSALVIARLFVLPLVDRLLGIPGQAPLKRLYARLSVNIPSQAGREDWIPARIIETSSGLLAEPVFFKSNLIFNLARADGLIRIPPDSTGCSAGETVEIY